MPSCLPFQPENRRHNEPIFFKLSCNRFHFRGFLSSSPALLAPSRNTSRMLARLYKHETRNLKRPKAKF